ncbi:MAG: methyltransferase family protein [Terriglobia bacterium]
MRDGIALFVLVLELPVPVFWLLVHPAVNFWRRHPRTCYYGVGLSAWLLVAAVLLVPRQWWLVERFSRHPLLALAGGALIVTDFWLLRQIERRAGWRVLVGLPELGLRTETVPVVATGIYGRVRHPRYLGMLLSWTGAVLLSGATRLLWLVAGFTALALLATELEERELLTRLGESYADYRRRVPRFIPRWRSPGESRGESSKEGAG